MAESCTPYAVDALGFREVSSHRNLHIFLLGLAAAAADAFGIGSNDVANSFATSVGSGLLSLRAACFIAVFTEARMRAALRARSHASPRSSRALCCWATT